MTVRGVVERCDVSEVSGWAYDDASEEPVVASIYLDGVELCRLRADAPRGDLRGASSRERIGFGIRFHPHLSALLPHEAIVSVRVAGVELPRREGASGVIENRARTSDEELRARLAEGWIVGPKSGNLFRPLALVGSGKERMLDALEECERCLRELTGHELMLAYGTLLGAVREGDLIGHDDDVDAIFYAPTNTTKEAARVFTVVVQKLREHGQRLHVVRSGQFHWHVFPGYSIDVFMGWFHEGAVYSYCAGGVVVDALAVKPEPWTFLGRKLQVPKIYERVLEFTYGPGWRVPDPSFQWRLSDDVRAQMNALEEEWLARTAAST